MGLTAVIGASLAKALGTKALAEAERLAKERDEQAAAAARNIVAAEAGKLILHLALEGVGLDNARMADLINEFEAQIERGARIPVDELRTVRTVIEKLQDERLARPEPKVYYQNATPSVMWSRSGTATSQRRPAAKKAAAKRPAAKKGAAKRGAAKKASAKKSTKRPAVKKRAG